MLGRYQFDKLWSGFIQREFDSHRCCFLIIIYKEIIKTGLDEKDFFKYSDKIPWQSGLMRPFRKRKG